MINLTVVIDNDEAIRKLRELQNVAKTTTSSVVKDSERMDASWQQMKNTLMSLTAGVSFAALAKQVVQIRGEVQQLEVAFETMLGSKEKADTLMSEIIDLAAKTPFGLQDVSNATKMLLAYGSTAEEVTGEIKMLGNIASGLSIPLNDLIYLYGTTRTQGRMFTMDLRQFMGRGIPLAEELAKQFGVTKDKVGELVTAGKVGFDDMAKALQAMSSEGGKFNNLMDKQSATISGQISNLEDSIYQMFNEIGRSSEGVISDLISGASWVVEHYQEILNVLKYVIAAYGSYKAALILVAAAQKAMALASSIKMYAQLATYITSAKDAMLLFNMAVKANPIGLLLSVLGTIGVAIWSFADGTEEATKQMGALEKAARDEYVEVNRLVATLQQGNTTEKERNDILAQLKSINPDIVKGISDEADMTATLTSNLKLYNEEQIKKIQLSAIGDKQRAAITDKANAEIGVGEAQAAAENAVKQIQAALNMGELTFDTRRTNANFSKVSDAERAKIEQLITAEISRILQSGLSDIDKVKAISNIEVMTNPSNSGGYRKTGVSEVGNVDLKGIIDTYNIAEEAYKSADEALVKITEDNEQLADILGLTGKKTENNAEAAKTYAQAYAEAQKAYIDAQKKFNAVKNDKNATTEDWQTAKDELESKKKAYEALGGVTSTKAQTDAQKQAKEAAELAKELQYEVDQAVIDAMVEGTEKKIAQIEFDYRKRGDAIRKQKADLMAKQGGALTTEQTSEFDKLLSDAVVKRDKAISATYESELSEMYNFLKEYGTFQQRKLALTEEYEQKIAKATSKTEKLRLEKERDTGLAAISAENLEQSINWELIFGDFGNMFFEIIRPEFEKLGEYLKTDEFKNADAGDKQTIIDAYNRLEGILGEGGDAVSFKALGSSIQNLERANANLKAKQDAYAETYEKLTKAQNVYKEALISGSDAQINAAAGYLALIEQQEREASDDVEDATNEKADAERNATDVAKKLAGAMEETIEGLNALSGASISGVLPAIRATAKGLEKFGDKVGDIGKDLFDSLGGKLGDILDFIFGLLDILKEGISGLVTPIIDSIFNAVTGIIGDILNFRDGLFRQLGESLYKGIMSIFESILTLGGWFDWINFDSDRTLEQDIQRLSSVNEALIASIDRLGATLDEQVAITEQVLENNRDMMQRSAEAWSNGFWGIGGSKSSATKVSEGISADEWRQVSDLLGKEIDSGWDFFSLEADELYEVASKLPVIWGKITDLANDGYKDASQYMEAVVENVADLRELENQIKEKSTGVSYDEFRNKFKSALLDMEMSAEDFANEFEQMLVNSIVDAMMTQRYDKAIQALYDKWAGFMEDGELTDEERAELEADKDNLYREIEAGRQFIKDMGLSESGSQSATQKGFQAMSQDTGDELNGRFTDIQGKVSGIHEAVQFMKSLGSQQLQSLTSIHATVADIRNDTTLIEQHTRVLSTMSQDLSDLKRAVVNEGLI